jgi:hypothetical protein
MKATRFLLAAVLAALAFTFFGCSSDVDGWGGGGGGCPGCKTDTPSASELSPFMLTQTQFNAMVDVIGRTNYMGYIKETNQKGDQSLSIGWIENKTTTDYNNMKDYLKTELGIDVWSEGSTSASSTYGPGDRCFEGICRVVRIILDGTNNTNSLIIIFEHLLHNYYDYED